MTRTSKQGKRRQVSPRRPRPPGPKTGSKKDALEFGYRLHESAVSDVTALNRFIPKIG